MDCVWRAVEIELFSFDWTKSIGGVQCWFIDFWARLSCFEIFLSEAFQISFSVAPYTFNEMPCEWMNLKLQWIFFLTNWVEITIVTHWKWCISLNSIKKKTAHNRTLPPILKSIRLMINFNPNFTHAHMCIVAPSNEMNPEQLLLVLWASSHCCDRITVKTRDILINSVKKQQQQQLITSLNPRHSLIRDTVKLMSNSPNWWYEQTDWLVP